MVGSAAQPMELLGSSQDPRQQLREYKVSEQKAAAMSALYEIFESAFCTSAS
jgi:hypothetical protein